MKVYIVTAGSYSDYHIEAVFTDKKTAKQYANMDTDRNVETYEADSVSLDYAKTNLVYSVTYDFFKNTIDTLCLRSETNAFDDYVSEYSSCDFFFSVQQTKILNEDVMAYGNKSKLLLKIAQDRFAKYCADHETSKEELIQGKQKRHDEWRRRYSIYSTSLNTEPDKAIIASKNATAIVHQIMANGESAPPYEEVARIYYDEREKAEHEQ